MKNLKLHPDTCIRHIHPRVTDLERAVAFYCNVLGFTAYGPDFGLPGAAFLAAGVYPRSRVEANQPSKEDR